MTPAEKIIREVLAYNAKASSTTTDEICETLGISRLGERVKAPIRGLLMEAFLEASDHRCSLMLKHLNGVEKILDLAMEEAREDLKGKHPW